MSKEERPPSNRKRPAAVCSECGSLLTDIGDRQVCLSCTASGGGRRSLAELLGIAAKKPAENERHQLSSQPDANRAAPPVDRSPVPQPESAPSQPPPPSPPLSLFSRSPRQRGSRATPLGFNAGSPCPRICGGTLRETEGGILICSACDFRYPEEGREARTRLAPPPPHQETGLRAEELVDGSADSLREEIKRLREENRRLMQMVYQIMQQQPAAHAPRSDYDPLAPPPVNPSESIEPEPAVPPEGEAETGPAIKRPWWNRMRRKKP